MEWMHSGCYSLNRPHSQEGQILREPSLKGIWGTSVRRAGQAEDRGHISEGLYRVPCYVPDLALCLSVSVCLSCPVLSSICTDRNANIYISTHTSLSFVFPLFSFLGITHQSSHSKLYPQLPFLNFSMLTQGFDLGPANPPAGAS